jgi:flagellar M-ring protein FliF
MDFLNKSLAQLSELFRSMTPGARITAGLLLAVVIVSLGYLFRQGTAGQDAFLFGGQALSDGELDKIQGALSEAGLIATRENNRLRVPAGQHAAYMAAIVDADALPSNFNSILEEAIGQSTFLESGAVTRARLKIATQKLLIEIIQALSWVDEAFVLYDEQEPRGLSGDKQVTASVNVRPAAGESLTPTRAKRLKSLVAGAVVGMNVDDVQVTDLNEGGVSGSESELSFDMFDNDYFQTKIAYETLQRERIANVLRDIPGVRVEVNAELDTTKEEVTRNVKPDNQTAILRETNTLEKSTQSVGSPGGPPGPIAQGPNRPGATLAQDQNKNETSSDITDLENVVGVQESRTLKDTYAIKKIHATILIPSSYIESVWKSQNATATEPPKPADLETVQSKVVLMVEDAVEPLMLLQANEGQDSYRWVTVQVLPSLPVPTIEPPTTTSQAVGWLSRYWSTLAMLGVAMFSLLVMRSVVKGGPSSAPAPSGLAAAGLAIEADETEADASEEPSEERPRLRLKKGKSLKDDLVEIVHDDPDAAAEILRSWIGKVA